MAYGEEDEEPRIMEMAMTEVEMEVASNKLSLFDKNRQIDITLAEESFIDNDLTKELKLEYASKVRINTSVLKKSLKNKSIDFEPMLRFSYFLQCNDH